jgi:hypothetical protein
MMRLNQEQCRGKKIHANKKLQLLHVQLFGHFDLSLECNKGPKHLLLLLLVVVVVVRARSQVSGCNAAIRLIVHTVF